MTAKHVEAMRELAESVNARLERQAKWLARFKDGAESPIVVNEIKPITELLQRVRAFLTDCLEREAAEPVVKVSELQLLVLIWHKPHDILLRMCADQLKALCDRATKEGE